MSTELNLKAERAAFEAFAKPQSYWWNGQTYSDLHTQIAWEAWQAARRTAPVSAPLDTQALPPLPYTDVSYEDGKDQWGYTEYGSAFSANAMREYATSSIAPYAERIRHLERERAAPAWAAFSDNGNVIIWSRNRSEVEPVAAKYDRPVEPILAYIDGHTAGTAPADPMDWPLPCDITVGNGTIKRGCKLRSLVARMESLHRMAIAALPKLTPEQQQANLQELIAAADPSSMSKGKEEAND